MKVTVEPPENTHNEFPLYEFAVGEYGILTRPAADAGKPFFLGIHGVAYFPASSEHTQCPDSFFGRRLLPEERIIIEGE